MESEATTENKRLDRIEHNLKLTKESTEKISSELHNISSALVGNEYTGGIGIVHQMKKVNDVMEKCRDDIDILKENMSLVKWFGSAIGGIVIALIIYILEKKL